MRRRALARLGVVLAALVALAAAGGWPGAAGAAGQAARLTVAVGLGAGALGTLVGGLVAVVAYGLGGLPERVLGKAVEAPLALPLALAPLLLGQGAAAERRLFAAFALLRAAQAGQQILAEAQALAGHGFVESARAMGAGRWRLFGRQLWPHLRPSALELSVRGAALVVPMELLLSPLGLGGALGEQVSAALARGDRAPLVAACLGAAAAAALLQAAAGALAASTPGRG